jgi:hypothetical protein
MLPKISFLMVHEYGEISGGRYLKNGARNVYAETIFTESPNNSSTMDFLVSKLKGKLLVFNSRLLLTNLTGYRYTW